MKTWTKETFAKTIDHTLLKATASRDDIVKLCAEARSCGFASVCVNPRWVPLCVKELKGSGVAVCTVIGFPLGANSPFIKAKEAEHAILQGAAEIDMVIDIGALKDGNTAEAEADIRAVVVAARSAAEKAGTRVVIKVIIETCYLTDDEKREACMAAQRAGADFVKTSTGFGTPGKDAGGKDIPSGAVPADVALMKETVGSNMKVKASGAIRTLKSALEMLEAGADRLGVSCGMSLIGEL